MLLAWLAAVATPGAAIGAGAQGADGLPQECLGRGLGQEPSVDACLAAAEEALGEAPDPWGPAGVAVRRGLVALRHQAVRLGEGARAAALWERVLSIDPLDAEATLNVARLRLAAGRHAEAERLAIRAAKLAQSLNSVLMIKESRTVLAEAQLGTGDEAGAARLFRHGVGDWDGTHPSDGNHYGCAYQGFGELYSSLRRGGVAEPSRAAAVDALICGQPLPAFDASGPDGWFVRQSVALLERRYDAARAEAGGTEPERAVVAAHLAIVEHEHESALAALPPLADCAADRLLARSRDLAEGWALANLDRHELARAVFERLVQREPEDRLARVGLGNSLLALGDLDGAEAAFDAVLRREPGNRYALAERALVRLLRGDEDGAEAGFRAALDEADNPYTCPHEGLGLLYLQQGRPDEAAREFERAIAINPDIEYRKYDGLARIRLQQGRLDEAEALLRRSLANNPKGEDARSLLADVQRRKEGP